MEIWDSFGKIEILEVITCRRNTKTITTTKRNTPVISIRTHGEVEFYCDDKTYRVDENNVLFIPKNATYSQFTTGESIIAIHFNGDIGINEIKPFHTQNKKLLSAFKDIAKMWETDLKASKYKIYSKFYYILSELQSICDSPEPDNKISRGYAYLTANFTDPDLQISSIASDLGISPAYFRKEFKALYGISPKEKLITLRLENAVSLIKHEYCNIGEAALQSGFNNTTYFSTLFKKRYGVPPTIWASSEH